MDYENNENEAMFDYSWSSGQVIMFGDPIGSLHDDKIKRWLRKTDSSYFSHRLIQAIHPKQVDTEACPYCGSHNMIVQANPGEVEIGFCPTCLTDLYRYKNKVYTQVANLCGYVTYKSIISH